MSVIGIGASEDGTLVVAYQGSHIGLYDTDTNTLVHDIVNTSSVLKPTGAYLDPEHAHLLITQAQGSGLTAWACFHIKTTKLLWTSCKLYTLSRPEWYCAEKGGPTTSLNLQNSDFYGVNLAEGINLETGDSMPLEPFRAGKVEQSPRRENFSQRDIQEYNCITSVYNHGVYHSLKATFDPDTNLVDIKMKGVKVAQHQLDKKYKLSNDKCPFSPVCKVFWRLGTNCLILILEDGQIQFIQADLSESKLEKSEVSDVDECE